VAAPGAARAAAAVLVARNAAGARLRLGARAGARPDRDGAGDLRGLLRYAPSHDHAPKMLAARGTRLGLIPHPGIRDGAGRDTARRIVGDLKRVGVSGSMVDLARGRSDGYDLSDWLHDRASRDRRELARALGAPRPSGASDRAQR